MPKHSVTAAIGQAIFAGKQAGKSNRTLAAEIETQFGVKLDQRTIGRRAKKTPSRSAPKAPAPSKKKASAVTPAQSPVAPLGSNEKLDEVERLEASIRRIEHLLSLESTPVQSIAVLSGELRKTFAALRAVKKALADGLTEQDTEANELRKLLHTYLPADAPKPHAAGSDVPDEPGSTGSGRAAQGA